MESLWIDSYLAAFLGGLATSVHCAGMCGPLTCGVICKARHGEEALYASILYHLSRFFSYGLLGGLVGWLGDWAYQHLYDHKSVIALFISAGAVFAGLYLLRNKVIPLRTFHKVCSSNKTQGPADALKKSLLLGLFTPFIPCGALYLLFSLLALTASPARAAGIAITFGLGTMPLLLVSQMMIWKFRQRIAPLSLTWIQRSLWTASFCLIIWRVTQYDTVNGFMCK